MQFVIESEVLQKFATCRMGVVRGRGVSRRDGWDSLFNDLATGAVERFKARSLTNELLGEHPHVAGWRRTYQAFGVKPKNHRPTHEAMARRLIKGDPLPRINPIVDTYLLNQVEHLLPHGGYDSQQLSGDVKLIVSSGGDSFEPLGGGQEVTEPGEIVYRDAARVLTRRWNYRDADATKITEMTRDFILMIEAVDAAIPDAALSEATEGLCGLFGKLFVGDFQAQVLAPVLDKRSFEL